MFLSGQDPWFSQRSEFRDFSPVADPRRMSCQWEEWKWMGNHIVGDHHILTGYDNLSNVTPELSEETLPLPVEQSGLRVTELGSKSVCHKFIEGDLQSDCQFIPLGEQLPLELNNVIAQHIYELCDSLVVDNAVITPSQSEVKEVMGVKGMSGHVLYPGCLLQERHSRRESEWTVSTKFANI